MKRKVTLAIIIFLIVGITFILVKNKDTEIEKDEEVKYNSSFISMMIEDDKGKYIESKELEFPNEGYMFNPDKSGCENGGLLSWNVEKQKVQASLISSDKCYAYFDKYDFTESCLFGYEDNLACELIKKKDNTLIYHDGICDYEGEENCDLEADDNNYRYAGASNIINNYVCLDGTTTSGKCTSEEDLYRIIGLFKNEDKYQTKVIKNIPFTDENASTDESNHIGYYWSGTKDNYQNVWADSKLNSEILNNSFISSIDKYNKLIIEHNYIVGGNTYELISLANAKVVYQNEIINPYQKLTCNTKIGLMYASDYGFAAFPSAWNTILNSYHLENIRTNNWLFINDKQEWTITPRTDLNTNAFVTSLNGYIGSTFIGEYSHAIRPVFYLDSKTKLLSGEGTESNPYRLKI